MWPSATSNCQCGHAREMGSIPGLGKSPGVGNGSPLQYSCLGNPLDREAWRATAQGFAKSQTQLRTRTMAEWQGALSFKFCVAQNRVPLGEYSVSLRRMCNLLWLGEVGYECQLNSVDWWGCSVQLCPYWYFLPAGFVSCWQRGTELSSCNSGFICFSLQFYQFLPHVFCCSVVRSMHSKNCYIFLENWPLYLFVMLLFIPDKFLSLNSALKLI